MLRSARILNKHAATDTSDLLQGSLIVRRILFKVRVHACISGSLSRRRRADDDVASLVAESVRFSSPTNFTAG